MYDIDGIDNRKIVTIVQMFIFNTLSTHPATGYDF